MQSAELRIPVGEGLAPPENERLPCVKKQVISESPLRMCWEFEGRGDHWSSDFNYDMPSFFGDVALYEKSIFARVFVLWKV